MGGNQEKQYTADLHLQEPQMLETLETKTVDEFQTEHCRRHQG